MAKDSGSKAGMESGSIDKAIKENDIMLFLAPNQNYTEKVRMVAGAAARSGSRICYVSANRPSDVLAKDFDRNSIDSKKFYFVDCVTKGVSSSERVYFVSSPKALTEINIALSKMLQSSKADICVFDSLSTLIVYEDSHVVIRFVHSIISAFRSAKSKGVMMALKDDMQSELVKDLSMFVDKIVEMG